MTFKTMNTSHKNTQNRCILSWDSEVYALMQKPSSEGVPLPSRNPSRWEYHQPVSKTITQEKPQLCRSTETQETHI